jgi:Flp pilus assembly protein protease CpaA
VSNWSILLMVATALFCIVRGVADIRQRRYPWGIVGLLLGIAMIVAPLSTISVKIDLPPATR